MEVLITYYKRVLIGLVASLLTYACSNSPASLYKSTIISQATKDATDQSHDASSQDAKKYSEVDIDTLTAGEGITVGNGQNDTEEVDQNLGNEGFLLACSKIAKNHFSCLFSEETDNINSQIKNIEIYDKNGVLISSDRISFQVNKPNEEIVVEIIVDSEVGVDSISFKKQDENQIIWSEDKNDEETANTSNDSETPIPQSSQIDCNSIGIPGTWLIVPGNLAYHANDFCVMKYEAKCSMADGQDCSTNSDTEAPVSRLDGTPWVSIDQADAKAECESLGEGFHLINNQEWMTIATNIANVGTNWTGGNVGDGQIKRGHSDDSPAEACAAPSDPLLNVVENDCTNQANTADDLIEQRTHILSNGEILLDLAGNVWEWTSNFHDNDKPHPDSRAPDGAWYEYTFPIVGTSTFPITDLIPQIARDNNWDSTQSIGMFYPEANGTGGGLL